jgi:hypothetical protein
MVIAEPAWLHTLGQIAGVLLLIELGLALLIVCALMVGFAVGAHWVHVHVIPPLKEYLPKAERAMSATQRGADRAVRSIAVFFGWRQRIETTVRVLLFGRDAAHRVYEETAIQASSDLQQIDSVAGLSRAGEEPGHQPPLQQPELTRAGDHDGPHGGAEADEMGPLAEHAG